MRIKHSPLGRDHEKQRNSFSWSCSSFSLTDPSLRSWARLSCNTYLFRDLTSHSSQLFLSLFLSLSHCHRACAWERRNVERGAAWATQGDFSATFWNKHFRSSGKTSLYNVAWYIFWVFISIWVFFLLLFIYFFYGAYTPNMLGQARAHVL